jgi:hypothetical protein
MKRFLVPDGTASVVAGLILVMSGLYETTIASAQTSMSSESGKHLERVVLQYLWPALDYGKKAGRVYYNAVCQPQDDLAISFPKLDVRPPSNGKTGIAAVRDIFRHEKDVSVKESDPGILRVRVGTVPDAILHVSISKLVHPARTV